MRKHPHHIIIICIAIIVPSVRVAVVDDGKLLKNACFLEVDA